MDLTEAQDIQQDLMQLTEAEHIEMARIHRRTL